MPACAVKRNSFSSPQRNSPREESTAWKKRLKSFCCSLSRPMKPYDVSGMSFRIRSNELQSVERGSLKHSPLPWCLRVPLCLISKFCRQKLRKHPVFLLKLCACADTSLAPATREHARIVFPQPLKHRCKKMALSKDLRERAVIPSLQNSVSLSRCRVKRLGRSAN